MNIVDSDIVGFTDYLIKYDESSTPGFVDRCMLMAVQGSDCVGIYNLNDVAVSNTIIVHCKKGIECHGSLSLDTIHIWTYGQNDPIGIDHVSGDILANNITLDTVKTCFVKRNWDSAMYNNVFIYNVDTLITPSDITLFESAVETYFARSVFKNIRCKCSGAHFTNQATNLVIGLDGFVHESLVMPTYVNKTADITFGVGTSHSWVEHNPATFDHIIHLKEDAVIPNGSTVQLSLGVLDEEAFGVGFCGGGLYSPSKLFKIFMNTANILQLSTLDGSDVNNPTGTFRVTTKAY